MEHEPPPIDSTSGEREARPEVARPTIENLPAVLGFVETEELHQLAEELTAAYAANSGEVRWLANRYHVLAEASIEAIPDDNSKARLGLEIRMALIRRDAGWGDQYLEDLEATASHAYAERYGDLCYLLDDIVRDAERSL